MAIIDYGAVLFKNGECQNKDEFFMNMQDAVGWCDMDAKGNDRINGNYFAYAGDEHMTVAVYKGRLDVFVDRKPALELWGMTPDASWSSRMSYRFLLGGAEFCLRQVGKDNYVFWLQFSYKGDHYNIVYGYGIDPDFRVWNKVKVCYLGRRTSRRVDRLYQRFQRGKIK